MQMLLTMLKWLCFLKWEQTDRKHTSNSFSIDSVNIQLFLKRRSNTGTPHIRMACCDRFSICTFRTSSTEDVSILLSLRLLKHDPRVMTWVTFLLAGRLERCWNRIEF